MTKQINVGNIKIGGGAPVTVQSMTTAPTTDIAAVTAQILELRGAGCDIVRVAVPDMESARAIEQIRERVDVPLVADIHFDYRLALAAIESGAHKIRINPGNIGGEEYVKLVADAARARGVPIRVGVNGGSLDRRILKKYSGATAEALVESAVDNVFLLERFDFDDICVSVKSSDVVKTIRAYRLLSERVTYPLHLGVTEAGTEFAGIIRNSAGISALLTDGIGDTIRVSLTADPVLEVKAGVEILRALGLRSPGVRLISCPTCARCNFDLFSLVNEVEERLGSIRGRDNITVAVMGCEVNGPGEARYADFGVAGGRHGTGVVFMNGNVMGKYPHGQLANQLFALIKRADDAAGDMAMLT